MRRYLAGVFAIPAFCGLLVFSAQAGFFNDAFQAQIRAIGEAQRGIILQQAQAPKSPAVQMSVEELFTVLNAIPDVGLYQLKIGDACQLPKILDCKGLAPSTVRSAVDSVVELRKVNLSREEAERSFYISAGGLGISVLSLLLSAMAFRKKTNGAEEDRPKDEPVRYQG
jgi:hypothetical protein